MEHEGEYLLIQSLNDGSDEDLQCTETYTGSLHLFISQSMSIILLFSIISSPLRFTSM